MIDRDRLRQLFHEDYFGAVLTDGPELDAVAADELIQSSDGIVTRTQVHFALGLLQGNAFFSKRIPIEVQHDWNRKALYSFAESQHDMAILNKERPWLNQKWFASCRFEIRRLLGDGFDEWQDLCTFGKGASTKFGGPVGRHITSKIGGKQTYTVKAGKLFAETVANFFPNWGMWLQYKGVPFERVSESRLAFVPKKVGKVRMIAIEPTANMFLQQGLGRYLSKRLRVFGLNLFSQTKNVELARSGSVSGALATIDLSAASDRIPRQLVYDLLPPIWRQLFFGTRGDRVTYGGLFIPVETYATMGNATTFPIESMVFWTVLRAAGVKVASVYGDDIIVRSSDFEKACDVLQLIGAKINPEKTFNTGAFRESCGGDFLGGTSVRPIFYKKDCQSKADVACLHNLLYWRYGYLPRTHSYLREVVGTPIYGPPMVVRVHETNPMANVAAPMFRSWFWRTSYEPPLTKYGLRVFKLRHPVSRWVKVKTVIWAGSRAIFSSSVTKEVISRNSLKVGLHTLPLSETFSFSGEGYLFSQGYYE